MTSFKLPTLIARTLACTVTVFAVASGSAFAQAADSSAHDAHDAHEAHSSTLNLDQGERWETDEPLRKGMLEIRHAVEKASLDFSTGALSAQQAEELTLVIDENVNFIIEQCKLEPEADANLHVILAEILNASSVLKSEPQSAVGLPRIHGALESYAYYFNHPDWSTEHDH
ncbi:MAG: hypothetical protein Q7U82_13225 [Gammaproteobacteria bacterium]|nr:hypothetical protein [Gammaproteobacteria bacterium]